MIVHVAEHHAQVATEEALVMAKEDRAVSAHTVATDVVRVPVQALLTATEKAVVLATEADQQAHPTGQKEAVQAIHKTNRGEINADNTQYMLEL